MFHFPCPIALLHTKLYGGKIEFTWLCIWFYLWWRSSKFFCRYRWSLLKCRLAELGMPNSLGTGLWWPVHSWLLLSQVQKYSWLLLCWVVFEVACAYSVPSFFTFAVSSPRSLWLDSQASVASDLVKVLPEATSVTYWVSAMETYSRNSWVPWL